MKDKCLAKVSCRADSFKNDIFIMGVTSGIEHDTLKLDSEAQVTVVHLA